MPSLIRTPDERFKDLPDFPYAPHYVTLQGHRIHYLDEGTAATTGETFLCLHGEPSWSYLYRRMIPPLAGHGRVVAMDWVGFGRSDKLLAMEDYSFHMHYHTLTGFLTTLDLHGVTLICQDWGGLLGLTAAAEMPERFARLVIMNTFLPIGEEPPGAAFLQWRQFVERVGKKLQVGRMMARAFVREESKTAPIRAAYDAPFPNEEYRAGAAAFPLLVPLAPDDPGAAEMRQARRRLAGWHKPVLILFSDEDPITRGAGDFFRELIPGAAAQPATSIRGAGHFLQEDKGPEIAQKVLAFVKRSPEP